MYLLVEHPDGQILHHEHFDYLTGEDRDVLGGDGLATVAAE